MIHPIPLATAATYGLLLLAVLALWAGRRAWAPVLTIAIVVGYAAGVLTDFAALWVVAFAGLCVLYTRSKRRIAGWQRIPLVSLAATGIIAFGLLLGVHALPGFHNFLALESVVLSEGAAPYTLYLNFDKTVVGICLLGLCYRGLLGKRKQWRFAFGRAAPAATLTIALVAGGALAMGYLTWQPKWTPLFWLWAPVNLFFVCLSEEAFFRGFIQREIDLALNGHRLGSAVAIGVSALLFGLAHFGGGISYVALATAAGIGYAIVYHRSQSVEASMLAHFSLNTTHFLLFTYPTTA